MADPLLQAALEVIEWAQRADIDAAPIHRLVLAARSKACLLCHGKGYVTHGNDGGPCGRCGETGIDPNPEERDALRQKWSRADG